MIKDKLPPSIEANWILLEPRAHQIRVPINDTRRQITEFLRRGGTGQLEDAEGNTIIEEVSKQYSPTEYENCAEFALSLAGKIAHPPITTLLWNIPTETLRTYGYEIANDYLQPDDIVAYRLIEAGAPRAVTHFGILQADSLVLSKLGMGDAGIYRHKLQAVPVSCGDVAEFYRYAA